MKESISRLKSKIISKELILNGSLTKQYKQCGKNNCRCRKEKEHWHGPYWIWTRKLKGKTITKTIKKEQVTQIKKAIKEMKELKLIIEKWRAESLVEIEKSVNSK